MQNRDRPLLRWIKGDGKDDHVTRSAIGLATRLLGETVDYRLDVNNIGPDRARRVLEWAAQPVELSFQEPADNLLLADSLRSAGCPPERYGYWWKWFPARARPSSPEMVLDGDMVIVKEPAWFQRWRAGGSEIYVTVDERCSAYGQFKDLVDGRGLYSGALAFPPGFDFGERMNSLLQLRPLRAGHDGTIDPSEQGCVAAAFAGLEVSPVPLHELPFGRCSGANLDYGLSGYVGEPWGYHFGGTFTNENRHFTRLIETGVVLHHPTRLEVQKRLAWLREYHPPPYQVQSPTVETMRHVARYTSMYCGRPVLVFDAGRGYIPAILADQECRVTALSSSPGELRQNLAGVELELMDCDLGHYPRGDPREFALIIANQRLSGWSELAELWTRAKPFLDRSGRLLIPAPGDWSRDGGQLTDGDCIFSSHVSSEGPAFMTIIFK